MSKIQQYSGRIACIRRLTLKRDCPKNWELFERVDMQYWCVSNQADELLTLCNDATSWMILELEILEIGPRIILLRFMKLN